MKRLIVCGGRELVNYDWFRELMYDILSGREWDYTIVTGGAKGADALAERFAIEHRIEIEIWPAKWHEHGRQAGFKRNLEMLASGVDGVIAFPGGSGTRHMVTQAMLANVKVINIIKDVGQTIEEAF